MREFRFLLDHFIKFMVEKKEEKAIVHCSAGIGRTGTTIALMTMIVNIYAQLNNGVSQPVISVFGTVRRMRERRLGMVQTIEQYNFIYQFMVHWLKENKLG